MTSFSVVVPTLGRPDSLASTIAAVCACDPAPEEVVVVDGDAAATARAVAESFADNGVRWVPSAPGLTRQRNAGMAEARGDVVVFLDDDARPAPDVFAHLGIAYT